MAILFFFLPSFLLIYAVFVWWDVRSQKKEQETLHQLPPVQFDGLFAEQYAQEARALDAAETRLRDEETRERLLDRAADGDRCVLDDAQTMSDRPFYKEVLQTLFTAADGDPKIMNSIAEYIVDSRKLRASREFAETMIELWRQSLIQCSLADILHLAALADDAEVFNRMLNVAWECWQEGSFPHGSRNVKAIDFLVSVESAYWLIDTEVRESGAGFSLKQDIAEVRRKLAAANRF